MRTIIYPVKDITGAKALYRTLLGTDPFFENPYYVGFKVGEQEIGLDPNGHKAGMTGPVGYWHAGDIEKTLQSLIEGGARVHQAASDVGGGKPVAAVKDADGNVIGLVQSS